MKLEKVTKDDPRRSDKVIAFHIPRHLEQEATISETLQTAATLLTVVSLFFRYRWSGWLSAFASIAAATNGKAITSTSDKRSYWSTILFSFFGLFSQYLPLILKAMAVPAAEKST